MDKNFENKGIVYENIPFPDENFPVILIKDIRTYPSFTSTPSIKWHEQLEIIFVTEGNIACECDFNRIECTAGDLIILNPCQAHIIEYHKTPATYQCLMVDVRLLSHGEDKLLSALAQRKMRFHSLVKAPKPREIFQNILREFKTANVAYKLQIKGEILKLLSWLFRNCVEENSTKTLAQSNVTAALKYVSQNYANEISIEVLASECCMNKSYFCRRFKQITGKTPLGYVNDYRLAKAHALLTTTDMTVAQIALITGFSDSNYFTRVFTRRYSLSPTKIRNKENGNE